MHSVGRSSAEYRSLDHAQRMDELVELQRQRAALDAAEQRLLAVMAADPARDPRFRQVVLDKEFVRDEIACALHIGYGTARVRLHVARTLTDRLPATLTALENGVLTYWHARVLVDAVRDLDHDLATLLEERVLIDAADTTVGEFRASVRKQLQLLDPADQTDQQQRTAADRRVEIFDHDGTDGPTGMSTLWALLPTADAYAIVAALDRDAARAVDGDERTMDQRRADTLLGWALHSLDAADNTARRRPAIQVAVALSTLLGLDEQPAELETSRGPVPLPAELARELAFDPTGTWRRPVTDPVGRLIDYGRTVYRPPTALTDHVVARDRTCRAPGCTRSARACHLDHRVAWEHGGPTDADNLHALCARHHRLKHEAGWRVDPCADGGTLWTSPTGHTYLRAPATYPLDHTAA